MESVSISNAARNAVDASTRAKEVSVTSEVASTVSDEHRPSLRIRSVCLAKV